MATLRQLQRTLHVTYAVLPIVAGIDKFTNLLTEWSTYLGANIRAALPMNPAAFMRVVGVIEIIAGLIVIVKPVMGAYIVMIWLICIVLALLVGTGFLDVAVRDLVMAIGAYTLAQLTIINKKNS